MLKKVFNYLAKQQKIPGAGEFMETLSLTLFWGNIVNIAMNAGTFYFTTLRYLIPWFDIKYFIIALLCGVVIAYVITFKFIAPSLWAFRGRMMNGKIKGKEIKVVVSGGFDPLNGLGHLTHITEAKKLGDWLTVIISRDDQLISKGNKPNGPFYPSIADRIAIIRELKSVDEVIVNIDKDLTCAESLKMVRPQIFAKGGDRNPQTMPKNEIAVCEEIGCKVVYNVGNPKVTSSSQLIRRANAK